jgi:hypothetical protein
MTKKDLGEFMVESGVFLLALPFLAVFTLLIVFGISVI